MELQGASYLYALATLSITFSGFSALITVLRQVSGGNLSRYESFLLVNYFLTGFAIAICSLLPPLLFGWGAGPGLVWRGPSSIAAACGIAVEAHALLRRPRGAIPGRTTRLVVLLSLSYWPAFALLLMTAFGFWVRPGFAPFASALTWIFAVAGIDYVMALGVLFRLQKLD